MKFVEQNGVLSSSELRLLAKPLALLLAIFFVFSVHLNAAIASGTVNTICFWSQNSSSSSNDDNPYSSRIQHCSLCIFADSESLGAFTFNVLNIGSKQPDLISALLLQQIASDPVSHTAIRAPPFS